MTSKRHVRTVAEDSFPEVLVVVRARWNRVIATSLLVLAFGCADSGTDVGASGENVLAYVKLVDDQWEIFTNNLSGTRPQNISRNPREDSDPAWSPDGRYIAYTHFNDLGRTDLFLYDTRTGASHNVMPAADYSATQPLWFDNSRIMYAYHKLGEPAKTYIVDTNGQNNTKVLDYLARIFPCGRQNAFYYKPESGDDYKLVHRTDVTRSYNEVVLDVSTIGQEYTNVYDYDPIRGKLLILIAQTPRITNMISEFDVNTRNLATIGVADTGFVLLTPRYSRGFSRIIARGKNTNSFTSKIVLYSRGVPRELVTLQDSNSWLALYSQVFSANDQYIVYSKNTNMGGDSFYWYSQLYVLNLASGQIGYIDMGNSPTWNPNR
jgi:hypothetical protein